MKDPPRSAKGPLPGWRWKAIIPTVGVLLLGWIAFQAIVAAMEIPSGHWIVIAAAAGAAATCFVTLTVLLVRIERPLAELKKIIGRVREGDLGARGQFARQSDDIGQLGRQFNEMIQELAENRAEIERLRRFEVSRAEHLAAIGDLAAGLAHEIRNPLAGIAGVVEVMGRELPQESSSRAVLPEVQSEIHRIQAILNDLLAYVRPRAPEFHLADMNSTVEQAVSLARQQTRTKPIDITFDTDKTLPRISHDPVQMQQVVLNLLLSRIQDLQDKGRIEVRLRQEGEHLVVRIRDSGKETPPESLAKMFKPFCATRKDGTGLRLPLAKAIVESHKGKIEVTSEPGQGAQFAVCLPISRSEEVKGTKLESPEHPR